MTDSSLMTPVELSDRWRIPVGTLTQWRHRKVGPPYLHLGRHVRYRQSDVEAWLETQATETTAA